VEFWDATEKPYGIGIGSVPGPWDAVRGGLASQGQRWRRERAYFCLKACRNDEASGPMMYSKAVRLSVGTITVAGMPGCSFTP
jgi:hypothetical protein